MSFHATIPILSKEVDNNKHLNNKKYTTALVTKSENVFPAFQMNLTIIITKLKIHVRVVLKQQ